MWLSETGEMIRYPEEIRLPVVAMIGIEDDDGSDEGEKVKVEST